MKNLTKELNIVDIQKIQDSSVNVQIQSVFFTENKDNINIIYKLNNNNCVYITKNLLNYEIILTSDDSNVIFQSNITEDTYNDWEDVIIKFDELVEFILINNSISDIDTEIDKILE